MKGIRYSVGLVILAGYGYLCAVESAKVAAQVQQSICLKQHEEENALRPEERAALENSARTLTLLAKADDSQLAQRSSEITNTLQTLSSLTHTQSVCSLMAQAKRLMERAKQYAYQHIASLQERIAEIDTRFATLKDPNNGLLYKSYRELLGLIDRVYDTAEKVRLVQTSAHATLVEQSVVTLKTQLALQEKAIFDYAHELFRKEYPRRVTECQPLMKQWLSDVEGEDIAALENALAVREQTVASVLGQHGITDMMVPSLQRVHKEFVMSPCWNKLKTKAQTTATKTNESMGRIVIQDGKNQEVYTEIP